MSAFSQEMKRAIVNVRQCFEAEKIRIEVKVKSGELTGEIPISYKDVIERTAEALKISVRSVNRVSKEFQSTGEVSKPKKFKAGRRKIVVDSFTEGVIRRAVLQFYADKTYPNLSLLHSRLSEDPHFPRMREMTLFNIMKKQLKFKFCRFGLA
jgi:hypothetical protein